MSGGGAKHQLSTGIPKIQGFRHGPITDKYRYAASTGLTRAKIRLKLPKTREKPIDIALQLTLVIALGLAASFWWNSSRARELAIVHAKRRCQQDELQFLDQTVSLSGVSLARDDQGRRCLERCYRFECTLQGIHRDSGEVIMSGHRLLRVVLPYTKTEDGNRVFLH